MSERTPTPSPEREPVLTKEETSAIENLSFPIHGILNQLKTELEQGEYELLIGDDISGRVPAIIMNEAIRRIYKSYGYPAPVLRFVAGGHRRQWTETLDQAIERAQDMHTRIAEMATELEKQDLPKKALVVTEAIHHGDGMVLLAKALEEAGIHADIAALGYIGNRLVEIEGEVIEPVAFEYVQSRFPNNRLIIGYERVPNIYGSEKNYLHGVSKEVGTATSVRFIDTIPEENIAEVQAKINAVRVLATRVGGEIGDMYVHNEKLERELEERN